MKNKAVTDAHIQTEKRLFGVLQMLLDADLEDPEVATLARGVLSQLRSRGHTFVSSDLEEPDCACCLHMALLDAAQQDPSLPAMDQDEILVN